VAIKCWVKPEYFVARFESLRGIAALMVGLSHAVLIFCLLGGHSGIAGVLWCLGNGPAAVTLFFVLSGFVLGTALRRGTGRFGIEYCCYTVRRCLRIYPAFLCVTLLIVAWLCLGRTVFPGIYHWLDRPFMGFHLTMLTGGVPGWKLTLENLLFLDSSMNVVTWTLKVEMVCSLALPALHCLSNRLSFRGRLMLLLGLIWLGSLGRWFHLFGWMHTGAFLNGMALKHLFLFYVGYLLPEGAAMLFSKLKRNAIWNGLAVCIALLLFLTWKDEFPLVQGLCAWFLLGAVLCGAQFRSFQLLDHPLLIFYGKISYSFYLLHDLCLVVAFRLSGWSTSKGFLERSPLCSVLILWIASTGAATIFAWICHHSIEKPFIRLSRRICARISAFDSASSPHPEPQGTDAIDATPVPALPGFRER
jgi:peptidoglycan/LPS O-acetylase OafA/YrhL